MSTLSSTFFPQQSLTVDMSMNSDTRDYFLIRYCCDINSISSSHLFDQLFWTYHPCEEVVCVWWNRQVLIVVDRYIQSACHKLPWIPHVPDPSA